MNPGQNSSIYVLAYFRVRGETLHLAASDDGRIWSAVNDNNPTMRPPVVNRAIRDPFLRRCPDAFYHLVATDQQGGAHILHSRSKDLVYWEPWTTLPVMKTVAGAKNAWAPEFLYDAPRRTYVVFWTAFTANASHKCIWYAETKDFKLFMRPGILFDPGYAVSDATMVEHEGTFYLIYKDERGDFDRSAGSPMLRVATAAQAVGPYLPVGELAVAPRTEGPSVFRIGDRWRLIYNGFVDGQWTAHDSDDLIQWDSGIGVVMPPDARHGTLFSLTRVEWQRARGRLNPSQIHHETWVG